MSDIYRNFMSELIKTCERNYSSSLLLSGGIDSSSIAAITATELGYPLTTVTVAFTEEGPDLYWAEKVASHLGIPWLRRVVSTEEVVEEGLPTLVKIMKSFDLGLLNDLPYLYGMRQLATKGFDSTMTGDGGDWLFGGYSFLWKEGDNYNSYVRDALKHIPWSSKIIAQQAEMILRQPYLDPQFANYVLKIPFGEKVKRIDMPFHDDVAIELLGLEHVFDGEGKIWGKILLREAMRKYLPEDVIWRRKTDLQFGSDTAEIEDELNRRIPEKELSNIIERTGIKFWGGSAQAYLYKLFESEFEGIEKPDERERICGGCGSGIEPERRHCSMCGYFE